MSRNRKDWADKIIDALSAYRTTFEAPLGMSLFRVVFGNPCHLLVASGFVGYKDFGS